jgi:hypothetical protein
MKFKKRKVNKKAVINNKKVEAIANEIVRTYDGLKGLLFLSGRKASYNDSEYEFEGGPKDELRKKHYDKSLRMLWKAQEHAPWSDFEDSSKLEMQLHEMALRAMTPEEKAEHKRITTQEFKDLLNKEYTKREKQAIVNLLTAIGHGEAYAWLVSAELLADVKSTGARTALSMQVLEEAKHFLVLRELIRAFDVPIPRQSAWEYVLLEQVYKAKGIEKFFGMNILIEGIALSIFGMLSNNPGLEILKLFHTDESRHAGLPSNYLKEFPLTKWQKLNPVSRLNRLRLMLPSVGIIPLLEDDMAVLGFDSFEFGGSVLRKITHLAERNGFLFPMSADTLLRVLNTLFNSYCSVTRPKHKWASFMDSETTTGEEERAIEAEIFKKMGFSR